jgi:GntR family transcriptional regulator/MocR family aminotransferase
MTVSFPVDSILLDRNSAQNLHRQLYRQLRHMIERQVLPGGTALPSTRALAMNLRLGRNTVISAYEQLALEGFLEIARGTRPLVKKLGSTLSRSRKMRSADVMALSERGRIMTRQPFHHGEPGITAFHPGLPDADNFPFNTWSKLLTRRTKLARADLFGSYHIAGYPPLCEAISRYLSASRGVACEPEQIIVTNGAQSAFDVLARLLTDPGDTVWIEEPGYYGARAAFVSAGARLVPLHVNDDGWNLERPEMPPRVIFVTPSCHHPLGITMNVEQRYQLINLAREWNCWILEDDYDSEYRFQGQPIPALQGNAADARVVFVGTFAKILFPAMRLGYMVIPVDLRERMISAMSATGHFAPLITQAALADFINEGYLTRHLRRMRRIYGERRETFTNHFGQYLGRWMDLHRSDSGIQLVGLFRTGVDDRKIAAAAFAQGINVSPLSLQYGTTSPKKGLLMGFAAAEEKTTLRSMKRLAEIVRSSNERSKS